MSQQVSSFSGYVSALERERNEIRRELEWPGISPFYRDQLEARLAEIEEALRVVE